MSNVLKNINGCTGCRACEKVCAFGAVSMVQDEEGFLYPRIDREKCTDCGMCRKICPAENDVEHNYSLKIFAAINKDKQVLLDSSSGGAFTALADIVFRKGGVVVGCTLDEDFYASQAIVSNKEELKECRGSKYVQSDTKDTYKDVKELLENGRYVLYTGTPCQIAGLKKYLNRDYENLLTADFICHGVPSPKLFAEHIKWLEKKNGHKIMKYRFRSKISSYKFGLYYYYYLVEPVKMVSGSAVLDPYYFAFLNAKTYRECCYQCQYAEEKRVGDFTFADYWSVEKFHSDIDSENGVSILMFNTAKGLSYLEQAENEMNLIPSRMEWIKEINYNLNRPAERPKERSEIYKDIQKYGYSFMADKYCSTFNWKLRNIYGKLPLWLRIRIKTILKK